MKHLISAAVCCDSAKHNNFARHVTRSNLYLRRCMQPQQHGATCNILCARGSQHVFIEEEVQAPHNACPCQKLERHLGPHHSRYDGPRNPILFSPIWSSMFFHSNPLVVHTSLKNIQTQKLDLKFHSVTNDVNTHLAMVMMCKSSNLQQRIEPLRTCLSCVDQPLHHLCSWASCVFPINIAIA